MEPVRHTAAVPVARVAWLPTRLSSHSSLESPADSHWGTKALALASLGIQLVLLLRLDAREFACHQAPQPPNGFATADSLALLP